MNILEELYYGNISPFERRASGEERELLQYITRHEQTLLTTLPEEQKAVFEKFRDSAGELQRRAELDAFLRGFRLGGQLMLAVVKPIE